jgi:pyrroline-5-carboxylate reductase
MSNQQLGIGLIGGGNMAQAIVGGLLRAGHDPGRIAVAEPMAAARERLAALHDAIAIGSGNEAVAAGAELLVLAVKPQVLPAVLAALGAVRRPQAQLVVSIAAGITLATLGDALGAGTPVVRAMPNQPALVGEGMTVLVASPAVSAAQKAQAQYVAEATGRALWIGSEALMDAVTAVSGSGPAYFYLLMELMEDAAVKLGLPAGTARTLVRQTALGAARAVTATEQEPAALRASVTSPGGTTAAALAVLESAGLGDIVLGAITAARDRGAELGHGRR